MMFHSVRERIRLGLLGLSGISFGASGLAAGIRPVWAGDAAPTEIRSQVPPPVAHAQQSFTLYFGQSNSNDLLEIARARLGTFEPYTILGLAYDREFIAGGKYLGLEWAAQLVKHFEKASLFEGDGLLIFRWKWFPWNDWIATTLGFGEGLSWASGYPSSESVSQGIRSKFLNYLLLDITFALPSAPEWALDLRIHHRSGVYGLINGVHGGSNYVSAGITRRF